MSLMSLQNLLDGVMEFRHDLCDTITLKVLLVECNSKINSFLASDSTQIMYGSYLLRYLGVIRHWSSKHMNYWSIIHKTLTRAGCKIIQDLIDTDQLAVTPFLFYAQHTRLTVDCLQHLPEVGLLHEVQRCLCVINWVSREGYFCTLGPFREYILTYEDGEWFSRWNSQELRLMRLSLTIFGDDAIKLAKNPNE